MSCLTLAYVGFIMKTRSWLLLAVFGTYLVGTTVEGVRPFYRPESAIYRRPGQRFKPTNSKCCKIGEKTAKRRRPCNIGLHYLPVRYNSVHRTSKPSGAGGKPYSKALATKIGKCSIRFSKHFEKCCNYRAQFIKELRLCKRRPGRERKNCRAMVRRRYP